MKKIFCFLLCSMLLAGSLIAPAGATESNDYAMAITAYLNVPYIQSSNMAEFGYIVPFNNIERSQLTTGYDSSVHGVYVVNERLRSGTGGYFVSLSWQIRAGNVNGSIPAPTQIYFADTLYNFTDMGKGRYDASVDNGGSYIILFQSIDNNVVTYQMLINYNYNYGDIFIPLDLQYLQDSTNSGVLDIYVGYTPTVVSVSDASNQDIIDSVNTSVGDIADILEQMMETNSAGSSELVTALNKVGANITSTQVSTSSAIQNSVNQVQATTQQVKDAVNVMEQNMSSNVHQGMSDYYEEHEKEETEKGNEAVQEIIEKLPLISEVNQINNAFDTLLSILSDTSTNVQLEFPPGTVSVAGTSYTFWDRQTVDLNNVFSNEYIQLLLVGFRFIFAFGFIKYLIHWINKIIGAVFMEDRATEVNV